MRVCAQSPPPPSRTGTGAPQFSQIHPPLFVHLPGWASLLPPVSLPVSLRDAALQGRGRAPPTSGLLSYSFWPLASYSWSFRPDAPGPPDPQLRPCSREHSVFPRAEAPGAVAMPVCSSAATCLSRTRWATGRACPSSCPFPSSACYKAAMKNSSPLPAAPGTPGSRAAAGKEGPRDQAGPPSSQETASSWPQCPPLSQDLACEGQGLLS